MTARVLIAAAFFLSGAAGLIDQVCWQYLLSIETGADAESLTVIVTTFMLGLGVGAMVGGHLVDRLPGQAIALFCIFECVIGFFGLFSVQWILYLDPWLSTLPGYGVALLSFFALLLPTVLMGATLPILVTWLSRLTGHVGNSTGFLYFANTAGATLGAGASGLVMLHWFDISQSLALASTLNFSAAAVGWLAARRQ